MDDVPRNSRNEFSTPSATGIRAAAGQTFRALAYRNFRLFFFGQFVSLIGTWMQNLALGWLVWRLTKSAWLLGLVGFAQMAPVLLLGLLGGMAADRLNRFKIVLWTQALSLVQAIALAWLTFAGNILIWEILALSAALGVINVFSMTGRQSFIAQMVPMEDLGNAIALNSSTFNAARIAGPALAGIVVGFWGEGTCFAINAFSFFAVILSLLAMRLEKPPSHPESRGAWRQMVAGLVYSWRTPHSRALLSLVMATGLFAVPFSVLLPAIAGGVLKTGAGGLGVLMMFSGVGALLGGATMAYKKGIRGLGRMIGIAATCFGGLLAFFGLSNYFWLSCLLLVGIGFCMMVQMAGTNTLLQSLVPDRLRGRLMAVFIMTFIGMAPIGSLIEGKLSVYFGVQWVVFAGGVLTLLSGIVFLLTIPMVRGSVLPLIRDLSPAPDSSACRVARKHGLK